LATTYNTALLRSSNDADADDNEANRDQTQHSDPSQHHVEMANLCVYDPSQQKITWEQKLFTGMDILVISRNQFGFKCQNQYITVDARSSVNVFVETVRYVKRCLDLERIKMHKKEIDEVGHKTKKKKKKAKSGFSLFSKKKKKHVDISKPKNVERHASYGEDKGFVPWDYLPQDYHPMLIANGITEKDWNLYGAKLMPVLTDFTTRTAVQSVRIQSGEIKQFSIQTPRGSASQLGSVQSPISQQSSEQTEEELNLPEGWSRYYDDDEKLYYYFNEIYDYSQWEAPTKPAHLSSESKEEASAEDQTPHRVSLQSDTSQGGGASKSTVPEDEESKIEPLSSVSSQNRLSSDAFSATTHSAISRTSEEYSTAASVSNTPHTVQTPTNAPETTLAPPTSSGPPPPPIGDFTAKQAQIAGPSTSGVPPPTTSTSSGPPPPPPISGLNMSLPPATSRIRRGSRAAPPKQKPATPATKPPDFLASIRQFSKENLRHVDPDEHKAPDLSKMLPNQKLSLMEVLKSRLTDLRDKVEGSGSSSSDDDSDAGSDESW